MRIISGFVDYYDGVGNIFRDDCPIFVRQSRLMTNEEDSAIAKVVMEICDRSLYRTTRNSFKKHFSDSIYNRFSLVFFCGKIYPLITVSITSLTNAETKLYTFDAYENYIKSCNKKLNRLSFSLAQDFFKAFDKKECIDLFLQFKSPCFRFSFEYPMSSEFCPNLNKLEFFKLFGAYQAYQELDMFVGGVMTQAVTPTVTITDKDRIVQHGFNEQSFRNPIRLKDIK